MPNPKLKAAQFAAAIGDSADAAQNRHNLGSSLAIWHYTRSIMLCDFDFDNFSTSNTEEYAACRQTHTHRHTAIVNSITFLESMNGGIIQKKYSFWSLI